MSPAFSLNFCGHHLIDFVGSDLQAQQSSSSTRCPLSPRNASHGLTLRDQRRTSALPLVHWGGPDVGFRPNDSIQLEAIAFINQLQVHPIGIGRLILGEQNVDIVELAPV